MLQGKQVHQLASSRLKISSFGARFLSRLLTCMLAVGASFAVTAKADVNQGAIDELYEKLFNPANGLVAKWEWDGKEYMRPLYPNQFKDNDGSTLNRPTVSEGTAYLMVFSALNDDQVNFVRNYNYWKQYAQANIGREFREQDGQDLYKWLMPWLIAEDGRIISHIPAADADLDVAYALLVADQRWGGYREDFENVLTAIREQLMMPNLKIVRPWPMKWLENEYGEASYYITSYNMPGYYRIFGRASGDVAYWDEVVSATYDWLDTHLHPSTGLNSYAAFSDGSYCNNRDFCDQFEVDAMRLPLRLAQAFNWENTDYRAKSMLDKIAGWTTSYIGTSHVPGAFYTSGEAAVSYSSPGMQACLASAASVSPYYSWWSDATWDRFANEGVNSDVYQQMVVLMSMMTAGGRFIDPTRIEEPQEPPLQDDEQPPGTTELLSGEFHLQDSWQGFYLNSNTLNAWEPVVGQTLQPEWGSMRWEISAVEGRADHYRLKNAWTGLYLNTGSDEEWQPVVAAPYNEEWGSMIWKLEAVVGEQDFYRLKNAWSGHYLSSVEPLDAPLMTASLEGEGRELWGSLKFRLQKLD